MISTILEIIKTIGVGIAEVFMKIFKTDKPLDRKMSDEGMPKPSNDDRSLDERGDALRRMQRESERETRP